VPIYDYICSNCTTRTEFIHGIDAPPPRFCPSCGAEDTLRKAFVAPSVHFKGSGWAKKDRSTSSSSKTKAATSSDSSSSDGSGSGGSSGGSGDGSGGGSGEGSGSGESSGSGDATSKSKSGDAGASKRASSGPSSEA
jgi:putative FmdB family regulatory protein